MATETATITEPAPVAPPPAPEKPKATGKRVPWYRVPVAREDLSRLNKKNNFLGFAQTLGYLLTLAITGTAAYLSTVYIPRYVPWYVAWILCVPFFLFHGTCWAFFINGFHELIHDSVFKQRWLNRFFLWIYSFLGWHNHIWFWASHTEHHKFTLHPPDDLEVVLPQKYDLRALRKITSFINPLGLRWIIGNNWRLARGKLNGDWEHHLFDNDPVLYRKLKNWARFQLAGHLVIFAVSMYFHLWLLPVVISLAPLYGTPIHSLTNGSQHIGLRDNVPDFRLCCRTIYLNPFLQFLYWHMNYHTEHHMYAAVPCYNLPKLHRLIKDQMPYCPSGLYETWKIIAGILKKQEADPSYAFTAELPPPKPRVKPTIATGANGNGNGNDQPTAVESANPSQTEIDEDALGVMAHAGAPVHDTPTTPPAEETAPATLEPQPATVA